MEDRFWSKVSKTDGCWLWTAYRGADGAGRISTARGKAPRLAHHVSWEIAFGLIPANHIVEHS